MIKREIGILFAPDLPGATDFYKNAAPLFNEALSTTELGIRSQDLSIILLNTYQTYFESGNPTYFKLFEDTYDYAYHSLGKGVMASVDQYLTNSY